MLHDLDLNNPEHLAEARAHVQKDASQIPLVSWDILQMALTHAEENATFRKKLVTELKGLLAEPTTDKVRELLAKLKLLEEFGIAL